MATYAAVRLAKEFVVKVGDMVVARCTDFGLSLTKGTIEINAFEDEGWEKYIADNKGWSITFGSMVTRDYGIGTGLPMAGSGTFDNLFDHWASAAQDYPVTVGIGDPDGPTGSFFEGEGILTDMDVDGSQGDKQTYSGTIQGSGKLERV